MKFANIINNNGEIKLINAYDENCKKYGKGFTCPYCGEKVDWVDGKVQNKHFRHHHSSFSKDCKKYCNSITEENDFLETSCEGVSLYLINELGYRYLAIGFCGLESTTIDNAEKTGLRLLLQVENDECYEIKVNNQNFVANQLEFCKINTIKLNYKVKFSNINMPNEIRSKWNSWISGIGNYGAIFEHADYASQKVKCKVGIFTAENYLLFSPSYIRYKHMRGIEIEEIQKITYGWSNEYKIYKLKINEINVESIEFCRKFDLDLHSSRPEIITLWPPNICNDNQIYFKKGGVKFLAIRKKGLDYSHLKIDINDMNNTLKAVSATENIELISFMLNKETDLFIKQREIDLIYHMNITNLFLEGDSRTIGQVDNQLIENPIRIVDRCFLTYFINDVLYDIEVIKEKSNIQLEIGPFDRVDILYGLDVIQSVNRKMGKNNEIEHEIVDMKVFNKIKQCKGRKIEMPDNFKWLVLKYKKYPKLYNELRIIMNDDKISLQLYNLLRNIIKNRGG